MSVELIVTRGSNRGTVAPIHPGYYLVGRSKECQIRPKSRSVSRKHCLLLRTDDGFGALDLKSTRGTYVNGKRIEPHQWRVLNDGDEIHFGKVSFTISVSEAAFVSATETTAPTKTNTRTDPTGESVSADQDSALESLQSFDVADFLEAEDAVEFEQRYGNASTPDRGHPAHGQGASLRPSDAAPVPDENDLSIFTDTPIENETLVGDVPEGADDAIDEASPEIHVDPTPKKRPPKKIDHGQYKRLKRRSISLPSLNLTVDWRLYGAIALLMAVGGVIAYQVYVFQNPPTLEVREGLD